MNKINDINDQKAKHFQFKYDDRVINREDVVTNEFSFEEKPIKVVKTKELDKFIFNIKI